MKKLFFSTCITLLALSSWAQVKLPQPSSTQTIKQDFGMGNIELVYSRPNAKGRKIFGDLVPFDKLWRLGANGATKISINEPIEIGGKKIDTGSYVLYAIPGKKNWEIIVNKGLNNWGIDGYKEAEDVVRFTVPSNKTKTAAETFTMQFGNVKAESCELQIMWEKTAISIPLSANIKDKLKAQIEAAMLTDKKPHWQAAQFYREYDKDLSKALENINEAVKDYPKAFWVLLYKARIQNELGDKAGAKESSDKSIELAKAANNDDYVKLNEKFQKEELNK